MQDRASCSQMDEVFHLQMSRFVSVFGIVIYLSPSFFQGYLIQWRLCFGSSSSDVFRSAMDTRYRVRTWFEFHRFSNINSYSYLTLFYSKNSYKNTRGTFLVKSLVESDEDIICWLESSIQMKEQVEVIILSALYWAGVRHKNEYSA